MMEKNRWYDREKSMPIDSSYMQTMMYVHIFRTEYRDNAAYINIDKQTYIHS